MARYHDETLAASRQLIARQPRQRGRLPAARVRRSVSTTYYALFHFLLDEVAQRTVGVGPTLLKRRRIVSRVVSHNGLRMALSKVGGGKIDPAFQPFFGTPVAPDFIRSLSKVFLRAQEQRHAADYDLNAKVSESSARVLLADVESVIRAWQANNTEAARDFKHALSLLVLLGGRLRRDDG